jgi:hypothetical protein
VATLDSFALCQVYSWKVLWTFTWSAMAGAIHSENMAGQENMVEGVM